MWVEEVKNGYKFCERYRDEMTGKLKKVSVTLEKNTAQAHKQAQIILEGKIKTSQNVTGCPDLTFKQLGDKYLAYQLKNVKMSTYRRNAFFIHQLETILDSDILVNKLSARYIRERLDDSGRSNNTKNEFLKRLKAFLRWGFKNDYISDISYLDKLVPYKDAARKARIEEKYLEKDEMELLLDNLKNSRHNTWYDLTRFLLLSGLRVGEALALTYKDIEGDVIHVTKTYDYLNNVINDTPKTADSNRDVFIQPELEKLIKEIRIHNCLNSIHSIYLFSVDGGIAEYHNYRIYLEKHSQKAIGRKITPHALRHTHASMLLASGVSIDTISRRLGHSNSRITREIYLHVVEQLKEKDKAAIKDICII